MILHSQYEQAFFPACLSLNEVKVLGKAKGILRKLNSCHFYGRKDKILAS